MQQRPNSALARKAWMEDRSLDAWLIWSIWQVFNPTLAYQLAIEPEYRIYRDTGAVLTHWDTAKADAKEFAASLASADGAKIFAERGWITPATH